MNKLNVIGVVLGSWVSAAALAHAQAPQGSAAGGQSTGDSISSPAFLEATLRQQWAAIDEQLQLRQVDQAALGEATKWRAGGSAPLPVAGKEGRVVFVFGATVPRVICAPLRVCDVELQQGESVNNVIAGDATAGLIKGLDLFQVDDNRHYFPPYDAAAVARAETLLRYPQLRTALERLSGRVSAAEMRAMNYAADVEHRDIQDIVREFIDRQVNRAAQTSP